jgi:hypothetical protein
MFRSGQALLVLYSAFALIPSGCTDSQRTKVVIEKKIAGFVDLAGDALPREALARIGTVRFRHANTILDVAYAPDGKVLV